MLIKNNARKNQNCPSLIILTHKNWRQTIYVQFWDYWIVLMLYYTLHLHHSCVNMLDIYMAKNKANRESKLKKKWDL